jgi:hypothetical protein
MSSSQLEPTSTTRHDQRLSPLAIATLATSGIALAATAAFFTRGQLRGPAPAKAASGVRLGVGHQEKLLYPGLCLLPALAFSAHLWVVKSETLVPNSFSLALPLCPLPLSPPPLQAAPQGRVGKLLAVGARRRRRLQARGSSGPWWCVRACVRACVLSDSHVPVQGVHAACRALPKGAARPLRATSGPRTGP